MKNLIKSKEVHIFIRQSTKMHSDQTVKFPYVTRSGNQYLMIVLIVDANIFLSAPFKNKTEQQLIHTYLKLKSKLKKEA